MSVFGTYDKMKAPGTVQIQSTEVNRLVLVPEPPSDPNHPLVRLCLHDPSEIYLVVYSQ